MFPCFALACSREISCFLWLAAFTRSLLCLSTSALDGCCCGVGLAVWLNGFIFIMGVAAFAGFPLHWWSTSSRCLTQNESPHSGQCIGTSIFVVQPFLRHVLSFLGSKSEQLLCMCWFIWTDTHEYLSPSYSMGYNLLWYSDRRLVSLALVSRTLDRWAL